VLLYIRATTHESAVADYSIGVDPLPIVALHAKIPMVNAPLAAEEIEVGRVARGRCSVCVP
jgi:hypothetical protein